MELPEVISLARQALAFVLQLSLPVVIAAAVTGGSGLFVAGLDPSPRPNPALCLQAHRRDRSPVFDPADDWHGALTFYQLGV